MLDHIMAFTSGSFAVQAQRILDHEDQLTRRNTNLAYGRKGQGFPAFCQAVYSEHEFPTIVTEEKVFGFLYYQAYRQARKRGRKRWNTGDVSLFDVDDFRAVLAADSYHEKPVAYDVVNQYLCSILKIWKRQVDMNANNLTKDQIRSERVHRLLATVKTRRTTIHKLNFEEKLQSEFLPYLLVEKVPTHRARAFQEECVLEKVLPRCSAR